MFSKFFLSPSTAMYDEIHQFREACGDAHMKTILAIGELGTFTNIYKASLVAMMAGQSLHDSITYSVMFQFVFDFLKPLSHMNCNSTNLSRAYPNELYVRIQMSALSR